MKFNYEGFTKDGKPLTGSTEASDSEAAAQQLREQGIFLTSIAEAGEDFRTVLSHDEDPVISDLEDEAPEQANQAPPPPEGGRRTVGLDDGSKEALRNRTAMAMDVINVILTEFKEYDLPKELQKEVSVDLFKSVFRNLAGEALGRK